MNYIFLKSIFEVNHFKIIYKKLGVIGEKCLSYWREA